MLSFNQNEKKPVILISRSPNNSLFDIQQLGPVEKKRESMSGDILAQPPSTLTASHHSAFGVLQSVNCIPTFHSFNAREQTGRQRFYKVTFDCFLVRKGIKLSRGNVKK